MGLCLVDVLVLLPAGFHKPSQTGWGIFPRWQDACCTVGSDTAGWKDTGCGDLQPVGWDKNVFRGVQVGLNYSTAPFPKVFLLLLGFNAGHLAYNC